MTPLLQAQITLDPHFIARAMVNLAKAQQFAAELLKYPAIFERFNNAASVMVLLDSLDPSDVVLQSMQRAMCVAKDSRVFLADLHRFIAAMQQSLDALEEIDTITTTLQVVYPRIPQPTATTDHTKDGSPASAADETDGKGVGNDIPF